MTTRNQLGPGLMLGIPTLGRPVSLEWALAFKAMNPPINFNTIFSVVHGQQVAEARNMMAQEALNKGCKYLFFLGDDVEVPPHGIRQLIHRLENNPGIDVVGGIYCSKTEPSTPLVFTELGRGAYWDWKIGEFFPVFALGMDCTLIRVEVFEKIEKPWFKTVDKDDFLDDVKNAEQWTEDLYFFNKLKEVGKVFCDASVICTHWDVYNHKGYKLPPDSLPKRQLLGSKGLKKLLMIGPKLDINGDWDIIRVPDDYRCTVDSLPFDMDQFDWVLVTQVNENPYFGLEEMKRVLKPGGKLSLNIHPMLRMDYVAQYLNGTIDGSFVEIIKDGNTVKDTGNPDLGTAKPS